MKKWLEIIKLLVLGILIIIVLLLLALKKEEKENIKVSESFQTANTTSTSDIITAFFDLSSNYYDFTPEEIGTSPSIPPDDTILNIGGSFGNIDASQIPWDSENSSISLQSAVYGIVPSSASAVLFKKLYMTNQINNPDTLPYIGNSYKYSDPLFDIQTNDQAAINAMIGANETMNWGQIPMTLAAMMGSIKHFNAEATAVGNTEIQQINSRYNSAKEAFEKAAAGLDADALAAARTEYDAAKADMAVVLKSRILTAIKDAVEKGFTQTIKGIGKLLGGLGRILFITPILLAVGSRVFRVIKSIKPVTGAAYKDIRDVFPFKVKNPLAPLIIENPAAKEAVTTEKLRILNPFAKEATLTEKILGRAAAKVLGMIGEVFGKIMEGFNLTGFFIYATVFLICVGFMGPAAAGPASAAKTIFDVFYGFVIMPIVLGLSLSNTVTNALDKMSDNQGCCPDGSQSLDSLIPTWATVLIGFVPVLGDLLSFYYPYMCFANNGTLIYKQSLTLPKYLNYSWCSTTFIQFPNYDCTSGNSPIHGKYANGGGNPDWNNRGEGYYTNLDDIMRNPNNYVQNTMTWVQGTTKNYSKEYILLSPTQKDPSIPVPARQNFMFCDFSEPSILVQMAQFYYDYSSRDLTANIDGTVSIDYISKINYVAASSLYSADIMCEITTVTYDPLTGSNYSEVVTYDHDRRFYFLCDSNIPPPSFWENTSNTAWMNLDDQYDMALYALNNEIHVDQNSNVSAEILLTAYIQKNESYDTFVNAATNFIKVNSNIFRSGVAGTSLTDSNVLANWTMYQFYETYTEATINYLNLFSNAGLPQPSSSGSFDTALGQPNTATGSSNAANIIESYLSTVVGYSNALWQLHLQQRPPLVPLVNNQYTVAGCTKLDQTASAGCDPDVTQYQYDTRYRVNLDVRPYLKLCKTTNMNITKCMDPSNIEIIVYNYALQNPNKRIRSIKSIKPKGDNMCEYIWDEDTINPDESIASSHTVTTGILYQIDLSSCTFCLPQSNVLYGNGNVNTTIPSYIYMNKNSISNISAAYVGGTRNPNLPDTTLAYKQASYNKPIMSNNLLTGFTNITNVDYIPRYYPFTFNILPDLIRPHKPIRVVYPQYVEQYLGTNSNNTCANPNTINQFLLDYNRNPANSNKVLRVMRAYTSDSNACDYEVDVMFSNNTVQRRTLTYTMAQETYEGFQNENKEVYLLNGSYTRSQAASICSNNYGSLATLSQMSNSSASGGNWSIGGWVADNSNTYKSGPTLVATNPTTNNAIHCFGVKPRHGDNSNVAPFNTSQYYNIQPYTYNAISNSNGGLNIQQNTAYLDTPFLDGYGFNNAYMDVFNTKIVPNITYFNNNLINNYTDSMKDMFNQTQQLQTKLNGLNTLHGGTGETCTNTCSDPEIMERILEQMNVDFTPKGRFNQGQSTIMAIIQSGTTNDNSCRVMVQNQLNQYADYYNPDRSSTNFLSNDSRLDFIEIQMAEKSPCVFYPKKNQPYNRIPANDPFINSVPMQPYPYTTPIVNPLPKAPFLDRALYMQVLHDYTNKLGFQIVSLDYAIQISPTVADYRVSQYIRVPNPPYTDSRGVRHTIVSQSPTLWKDGVIRVTYDLPLYYSSGGSSLFTYTPGNFVLHVYGDITQNIANYDRTSIFYNNFVQYSIHISSEANNASPLITIDSTPPLPTSAYTTINAPINISPLPF